MPEYLHKNPLRKGLVERREDWRWSRYNNLALDKVKAAACLPRINHARLPLECWA